MSTRRKTQSVALCLAVLLLTSAVQAAAQDDDVSMAVNSGIQFPDGTVQDTALVGIAPVEDTGQERCWDEAGSEIPCAGTGQDGELQAGADWPAPRFRSNDDGTVTDRLTGLIWLQDGDCFGPASWIQALANANALMDGSCGLTDGSMATEWRLPNIKELVGLIDFGETAPALAPGHPFGNVRLDTFYWTSTSAVGEPSSAWGVGLNSGNADVGAKNSQFTHFYTWPVREAE